MTDQDARRPGRSKDRSIRETINKGLAQASDIVQEIEGLKQKLYSGQFDEHTHKQLLLYQALIESDMKLYSILKAQIEGCGDIEGYFHKEIESIHVAIKNIKTEISPFTESKKTVKSLWSFGRFIGESAKQIVSWTVPVGIILIFFLEK